MPDPASLIDEAKKHMADDGDIGRKTALVTGSVALGAVLTGSLFRRLQHLKLKDPDDLKPALEAEVAYMEVMEGRACFYRRDGTGVPLVLLHSINAAASSFEMKPIFDHFARNTTRPLYALDWLGFGRSDRPPVRYSPSMYLRQLRRFLSEHVHQPADVVALSQSTEYAAEIGRTLPYLFAHLVLISPTGLSTSATAPAWRKAVVSMSDTVGAFEVFYYRLTRPQMLRRFYEREIFRRPAIPAELVDYARDTSLVAGAHHAARYFIQGDLTLRQAAQSAYRELTVPTLLIAPEDDSSLIQQFDALDGLVAANPEHVTVERLPCGLMPQWEVPNHLFDAMERFLTNEPA